MKKLMFDFNNSMAEITGKYGFTQSELSDGQSVIKEAHHALSGKALGFRRLPKGQADIVTDIIRTAEDIKKNFRNFVVRIPVGDVF